VNNARMPVKYSIYCKFALFKSDLVSVMINSLLCNVGLMRLAYVGLLMSTIAHSSNCQQSGKIPGCSVCSACYLVTLLARSKGSSQVGITLNLLLTLVVWMLIL